MIIYAGVLLAIIALGYLVATYNRFVQLKNGIKKAWANIDVLLKQRHDELPKLVAVCKEYMRHEQETLERVVAARSRVNMAREGSDFTALAGAEGALRSGLSQLFALVESYPDLKANENFLHLRARITSLENAIADRRELYNESVNNNNVAIESFPDLVVARWFKFEPGDLLYFAVDQTDDVAVESLFKRSA